MVRRLTRHVIGPVKLFEAADALRETARLAGKHFEGAALERAAEASAGYPFMIQLIGYHAWRAALSSDTIDAAAVNDAIPQAEIRLGTLVLVPALADLSPADRRFLLAMSLDAGPSKIGELARRLDFSSNQTNQYRLRLLDSQMISAPSRGIVDIAMPYLRSLHGHAISTYVDLTEAVGHSLTVVWARPRTRPCHVGWESRVRWRVRAGHRLSEAPRASLLEDS